MLTELKTIEWGDLGEFAPLAQLAKQAASSAAEGVTSV